MSEVTNGEALQERLERYVAERHVWLQDAVEVVTGDRETPIEDVFQFPMQNPQEARAAAVPLDLSAEQEQNLREIAGRFGIGGETNVVSAAEHHIMEGGKPWKVEGEAAIARRAQTLIFAGSALRKIGEDESSYMAQKYGVELAADATEYDMVRVIAEKHQGFTPLEKDVVLPFGYAVAPGNAFVAEPTEQLVHIGRGPWQAPVLLLKVEAETYKDEEGKEKQRFRPDSAALMGFVAQVLSACGDETSRVALNTSTTYAARVIDTMRAGLAFGRAFEVGMYGRQELADIKLDTVASPTEIQNIPGELRIADEKLRQLDQAIHSAVEE